MEELEKYYRSKLEEVSEELYNYNQSVKYERKATNPFFIFASDEYLNAKKRIIIYGQETNSWCNEFEKDINNSPSKLIKEYKEFFFEGGINTYNGPFWNEFKRIRREIEEKENMSASFLWNNVNKIGRNGKGNVKALNEIQFKHFLILEKEIELLKPNVLVFLTGPKDSKYNVFIEKNLGRFNETEIGDSLWSINFENSKLNGIEAFKTFHPNALYFRGKNRDVISNLIEKIKNVRN